MASSSRPDAREYIAFVTSTRHNAMGRLSPEDKFVSLERGSPYTNHPRTEVSPFTRIRPFEPKGAPLSTSTLV
jgi:hypothetical protein